MTRTRPPCPVCIRRLPIDIDLPTPEELRAAIVRTLDKLQTQYHDEEMRRDLETIRSLLMEEQP
jgi:hypothetical protein